MPRTDHSGGGHDGPRDQEDRVVSRRSDTARGTDADPADERAYAAAQSEPDEPDTATGGSGGTAERAGAELDDDDEDQPTRSE